MRVAPAPSVNLSCRHGRVCLKSVAPPLAPVIPFLSLKDLWMIEIIILILQLRLTFCNKNTQQIGVEGTSST